MTRMLRQISVAVLALIGVTAGAQPVAYGLSRNSAGQQILVRFSVGNPAGAVAVGTTGSTLLAIDFRPATGALIGTDGDGLFTIDLATGAATRTASLSTRISGPLALDVNPTVDRVRMISASGTNLRVNPITGDAIVDGAYRYGAGDPNAAATPSFTAAAYTNSDNDPATGTTLFGIDGSLGTLVRIASPNGGDVFTVGSLGLGANPGVTGFDIFTNGAVNTGYFVTIMSGATRLYTIDLTTGAASSLGGVGGGFVIDGLAITPVPEPMTLGLTAAGVALLVVARRRHGRQGTRVA
jgi:hypothetical protein